MYRTGGYKESYRGKKGMSTDGENVQQLVSLVREIINPIEIGHSVNGVRGKKDM